MIHLSVYRVHPEKVEQLKAWLAEVESRADEVRETFVREGVRHEVGYLLETSDGPFLVYANELEDYEAALAEFLASQAPIDLRHKEIMPQVTNGEVELTRLLDIRL
jgi:hypothetical protein